MFSFFLIDLQSTKYKQSCLSNVLNICICLYVSSRWEGESLLIVRQRIRAGLTNDDDDGQSKIHKEEEKNPIKSHRS